MDRGRPTALRHSLPAALYSSSVAAQIIASPVSAVQGSESALKPWCHAPFSCAGLRADPDRGCEVSSSKEVASTAAPNPLAEPSAPPRGFSGPHRRSPSGGIEPGISRKGGEAYPQQHERLVPSSGCQRGQESIQRKHSENAGPHPPLRRPRSTSVGQVGEDDCGHDRDDVGHAGQSDKNDVVHSPIRRLVREPYPQTCAARSAWSR